MPLYHCFGMGIGTLGCIAAGTTMVYPSASFEPLATLQAVQAERCTSLYGVPTMFIAQLEHPRFGEFDLSSLRTGLMGGASCPIEVMKRVMSDMHASEMCILYGMTETSPGIMAWIVARENMRLDADEVRAFCRVRLAHFKVPRYVKLTDAFSLTVTVTGKVQKYRLRELAIEALGLQTAAAIRTA